MSYADTLAQSTGLHRLYLHVQVYLSEAVLSSEQLTGSEKQKHIH